MALRHYNVYLDDQDPIDARMIALLEPAAKKRRAGEVLRRALDLLLNHPQLAPSPMPALAYAQPAPVRAYAPPPPVVTPTAVKPVVPPPVLNDPSVATAVAKARSSFMRRG